MSAWVWPVIAMNAAVIALHSVLLVRHIRDGNNMAQINLIWIAMNALSIGVLLT